MATTGCSAIESRNWSAWVNRMPGPHASATLHVEGEIDLPTPGYVAVLHEGSADRSAVPTQQFFLELTPPSGIAPPVVKTETVRYQGPAIAAQYRGVRVMCGDQLIAAITDVRDVH